jgi:hypothetical protein
MGYLNNQIVTVDAILTKKGRELLAKGDGTFKITQYALADDEIDYTMYNPSHPSGSAYYGEAIENMPLLEAFPDETQIMKYKLATLPRDTAKMPIVTLGQGNLTMKQTEEKTITPQTLEYLGNNSTFESSGYLFIVGDARLFSSITGTGIDTQAANALNSTQTIGTNISKTVIGTSITLQATGVNTLFGSNSALYSTLTVVGRDSGARVQIPITINKTTT